MNYAELQTAVLEDTHRPDLVDLVARFIREGEGMMRRDLSGYLLTTTLQDIDRLSADSPLYQLPPGALVLRRVALQGRTGPDITRVALGSIGIHPLTNAVTVYAEAGDGTIEFRGNPADGSVFDVNYFGMPPALIDADDTNALLEEHETVYKAGAMFYVYQHTQDRELASDALDVFNGVIETLNEQIARKIGGVKIAQSYNFNGGSTY